MFRYYDYTFKIVCVLAFILMKCLLLNPEHFLNVFFPLRTLTINLTDFYIKACKASAYVLYVILCEILFFSNIFKTFS